ncbi:K/Mg/Cd/Cu/Zn/Na/Ca/Na/H-transporter ATPase [Paracholeplasma brassicae]|uniref:K/Mg/Cd/Cu/Zn/Na/Ca/Na/H-transporter ATPase n=1 Tax=Acholeplasma brassicae TaxID=61635 RepID=U4KTE4_9MOLU|nr:heavy metal translocating P-type ATPase [Paracholeplasma brassicae]CCV66544.1 K/Mg/Cd/Cu/Zn/Na/Ca/Na/H-transporter ATPase [Paracholeplasma brassicae]
MHTQHNHTHHQHNHKKDFFLFILGTIFYLVGLVSSNPLIANILFVFAILLSGLHVIKEGFVETLTNTLKNRKFSPNIHLLMTLSALGAILIDYYDEAALLILIFAGAHFLEDYAKNKSKNDLVGLIKLNPTKARRLINQTDYETIDASLVNENDTLLVLKGDQVPTDGMLLSEEAILNEQNITGESMPVEKKLDDTLYASTINLGNAFKLRSTKKNNESLFYQIVELAKTAQNNHSKTASLIKRIEPIYVTTVLILSPLFFILMNQLLNHNIESSFYKTMVFLIGASPCAIAMIDIPATLSSLSNLAKQGVLVKGGMHLDNLSRIDTVVFDKTGTLSNGNIVLSDLQILEEQHKSFYLDILYSLEKKSTHPIAQAIINHLTNAKDLDLDVTIRPGFGLEATYQKHIYQVLKPSAVESIEETLKKQIATLESEGKTVFILNKDHQPVLLVGLTDTIRENACETIQYFKSNGLKTILLTGDSLLTANAIKEKLNLDESYANVLPLEKSEHIDRLIEHGHRVLMIGDGINDTVALKKATIGIAMGSSTDALLEVSDVVLTKNDLLKLTHLHKVSKRHHRIVLQNLLFSFGIVLFLTFINIFNFSDIAFTVILHEGSTILVILNGLRLLKK